MRYLVVLAVVMLSGCALFKHGIVCESADGGWVAVGGGVECRSVAIGAGSGVQVDCRKAAVDPASSTAKLSAVKSMSF